MANSTEVSYGFGQMGSILITGTTNAVTIIGGRDSDATPASNVNRTEKVFVAIQFLEDTVFDGSGLKSEDNTQYINSEVAQTGIDANGGAVTDSVTFPKGMTIYGRWTEILLDSGKCIAYIGY
jgi:hypothetical protein